MREAYRKHETKTLADGFSCIGFLDLYLYVILTCINMHMHISAFDLPLSDS